MKTKPITEGNQRGMTQAIRPHGECPHGEDARSDPPGSLVAPLARPQRGWRRISRAWGATAARGTVVAGLALACLAAVRADDAARGPLSPFAGPATDGLGRRLPLAGEVPAPRPDRYLGIFYFLWHDPGCARCPYEPGPYDVSKIFARDADALQKPDSPLWGPNGAYHYWSEPLFGYYASTDAWVIRRHACLLADAGIDVLILDATNAVTYRDVYRKLCAVFTQMRAEGNTTPQLAFMVNTRAGETARKIYEDLYRPGLAAELWFRWDGKPLLICDPQQADEELRGFFTLRRAHWPFEMVNTPYAWHWEATYPQPFGYTEDPAKPEQVNVSVAQNLRRSDGRVTNMSSGEARGRSFHRGIYDRSAGAVNRGLNFQEQWQRVWELDPPFVMVTGWNEWIAGRWNRPGNPLVFVDQLDQEFSRDIEPMRGGHADHYYYQLAANARRYKGLAVAPEPSAPRTIDIAGGVESWESITPEYRDHTGETQPRDEAGAAGLHYANATGRNDFAAMKVARDAERIYFLARTRNEMTPVGQPGWMWLLIDADQDAATGWQGFDFIVNRVIENDGTAWLERHRRSQAGEAGGEPVSAWAWEQVAPVAYRVDRSALQLSIPRAALGLPPGTATRLDFQWLDNAQRPGEILDTYVSGDAAPEGRFRYRYDAR